MNVSILKAPDEKHDPITIKINTVLGRPDLCKSGWWGNIRARTRTTLQLKCQKQTNSRAEKINSERDVPGDEMIFLENCRRS